MDLPGRPLAPAERQLWLVDRVTPFHVSPVLELDPAAAPDPEGLARALGVVQARHPLLRVACAVRDGVPAFVPSAERIPLRIRDGVPDLDPVIEAELREPFPEGRGPLARASLVTTTAGAVALILTVHHAICDGTSLCALIEELLLALQETARVPPRLAARSGEPELLRPAIERMPPRVRSPWFWLRFLARRIRDLVRRLRGLSPLRVPHRAAGFPDRATGIRRHLLAPGELAGLERRAAAEGASVHAALCAATLLALRERFAGAGPVPLAIYSPTDLRPRLRWAEGTGAPRDHLGVFVGYARSWHRVEPRSDLWALAREVRGQVGEQLRSLEDLGWHALNDALMRLLAPLFRASGAGPVRLARLAERTAGHSTVVTSLGEAAAPALAGAVRGLWLPVSTIPGNVVTCSAIRIRGALGWTFAWTEPSLDRDAGVGIADAALSRLRDALTREAPR